MAVNDIVMSAAGASGPATFVEDVFSTWLYTGTGSPQTITNGIDLSTKGGLVWVKTRGSNEGHGFFDTNRGVGKFLRSNTTGAEITDNLSLTSFNSNGFSAGTDANNGIINYPWGSGGDKYASWTFRKQPKFFDIVTYTGTQVARTIAHNLGSAPGCMIIKRTDTTGSWWVYHRGLANPTNEYLILNNTGGIGTSTSIFNNTAPTSSVFSLGATDSTNASGGTYVAYLFAHDAGEFGATGTDNVISCGSFDVVNGVSTEVNLGYEPQFVLIKRTDGVGDWRITDNMRGFMASTRGPLLSPNTSNAEVAGDSPLYITSTGFKTITTSATLTYIYIAIRRPMKTPTTGTSVYNGILATSSEAAGTTKTTGFPIDFQLVGWRDTAIGKYAMDRLRSVNSLTTSYPSTSAGALNTTSTSAEDGGTNRTLGFSNTGFNIPSAFELNNVVYWNFKRASGFFDVVCYTGTGVARTVNHNLGVAPELMIVKSRSAAGYSWCVYSAAIGNTLRLELDSTSASVSSLAFWNSTTPTSSVFTVGTNGNVNANTTTYVSYLFATVAGVSKVGSYTGNGSSQTINCGFTTGARFVMIKRTDSTGDWYVWDSARGIVSGNDPHLSLNTTAAEVTTDDSVDADSSGFIVNQLSATNVNVNTATYIFLAIA